MDVKVNTNPEGPATKKARRKCTEEFRRQTAAKIMGDLTVREYPEAPADMARTAVTQANRLAARQGGHPDDYLVAMGTHPLQSGKNKQ